MIEEWRFRQVLKRLNSAKRRKKVLNLFLCGQSDADIARVMGFKNQSSVRTEISNLCKDFSLGSQRENHDIANNRDLLKAVFKRYKPEWLSKDVCDKIVNEEDTIQISIESQDVDNSTEEMPTEQKNKQDNNPYLPFPELEFQCQQELSRRGGLVRIRAPIHMGKTLFKNHILDWASKQSYIVVDLSLNVVGEEGLKDLDSFLRWFCYSIEQELKDSIQEINLPENPNKYWDTNLASAISCRRFFRQEFLKKISAPKFVISLDDLDRLYENQHLFEDFLGIIRDWRERAIRDKKWKKIHFILVHSRIIYIRNEFKSPFNIGTVVELPEFNCEQILDLAHQYGLQNWNHSQVKQLMEIVSGYPCLITELLDKIKSHLIKIEDCTTAEALINKKVFDKHLIDHKMFFAESENSDIRNTMQKIVQSTEAVEVRALDQAYLLESMGLVTLSGDNYAVPRCKLYRQYFQQILGSKS